MSGRARSRQGKEEKIRQRGTGRMKDRRWSGENRKGRRVVGRNEGRISQQEDRCGMPEKRKWKAQDKAMERGKERG